MVSDVNWDGLHLIHFVVLPHWGSEEYDAELQYAKSRFKEEGLRTVEINDTQYLLIENGEILS